MKREGEVKQPQVLFICTDSLQTASESGSMFIISLFSGVTLSQQKLNLQTSYLKDLILNQVL